MKRRDFLKGILAAGVAPAVVKAENIMKIAVPPKILVPGKYGMFTDGKVVYYANPITIGNFNDWMRGDTPPESGAIIHNGYGYDDKSAQMIRDGGWREIGGDELAPGIRTKKYDIHDEYGIVIDAEGRSINELYEDVKQVIRHPETAAEVRAAKSEAGDLFIQGSGSVARRVEKDIYNDWKRWKYRVMYGGRPACGREGKTFAAERGWKEFEINVDNSGKKA